MAADIEEMLESFARIAADPRGALDRHCAAGKRVVGVGPYYVPEELVHAAGAVPFGVWGAPGSAPLAQEFFPPFYCSICQTSLELGLSHRLDKLSGMMVTGLCDTLKAFSQNWKAGVQSVPLLFVSQPQNRGLAAGREYTIASYREARRLIEECCGAIVDDDCIKDAIRLYNEWRSAMRTFFELAGTHPAEVGVAAREAIVDSGYYLDKAEHLRRINELNAALAALPPSQQGYSRIVVSGIYANIPAIADMLDENEYAIVADDLARESRALRLSVSEEGDPIEALADGWCGLEGDSVIFDPKKTHIRQVKALVKESDAQGVVILLAKFCDPEEFDAPLIAKACREDGVPCVTIEVDQSTESYEQARTQLETFKSLL